MGKIKKIFLYCINGILILAMSTSAFATNCECEENNSIDSVRVGMSNPAAVYCSELGYEFKIIGTPTGQQGFCVFPDSSQCDAWDFFAGKCGQEYSHCELNGYDIITLTDGRDPISKEYSVCVDRQSGQIVGSITELMSLSRKATKDIYIDENDKESQDLSWIQRSAPSSIDWRNYNGYNWMTPVKDQGICGSCWAFSAVGTVEARFNIQSNNPELDYDLSEQYIVSDCLPGPPDFEGYNNCCGGFFNGALTYIRDNGIPDESCLSYVDGDSDLFDTGCSCVEGICLPNCTYTEEGKCSDTTCSDRCEDWEDRLIKIYDVHYQNRPERQTIKEYIADFGPLAVATGVGILIGGHFDGDIYRCIDDSSTNHAVILVGYNDADEYWIVKNSWGSTWNGDGYFRRYCGRNGLFPPCRPGISSVRGKVLTNSQRDLA